MTDTATNTPDSPHDGPDARPLRVAVTGASGMLGEALVPRLRADGHTVLRLVRSRAAAGGGDAYWNPAAGEIDAAALEGVDAVVHLAGENVGHRWTAERKRRIRASRVEGTRLLAEALARLERPPAVLVSASAVGYYGDRGDELLDEGAPPGEGFMAEVVRDWEAAAEPACAAGIRVVHPRMGVVLSAAGGAVARMLLPFRLGVGGPVGSGRQWLSWITRADAVGLIVRAIGDEGLRGPVNVAAGAVRFGDFARALGRVLHRPALLPVPAPALRLIFGEMADATLLASARVDPAVLRARGHRFLHPELEGALRVALEDA
jgi:uncharacterized protein